MKPQPTYRASLGLGNELSDDELEVLFDTDFRPTLKSSIAAELAVRVQSYFKPFGDLEVPEQYVVTLGAWRKLADSLCYNGPVVWRVKEGFTLKHHAPRTGACYKNWDYLQDWKFQNDEPTKDSTVFWIPRLVSDSRSKTVPEQLTRLAEMRKEFNLPENHLANFGSGALLAGLILAHFKREGERVPLESLWARTDTLFVGGVRFSLGGFVEGGLHGGHWVFDDGRDGALGVFPPGGG